MPFTFTNSSFPIVKFSLSGKMETDREFADFTNLWEEQYKEGSPFTIIFDTRLMGIPEIKYAVKLTHFIKKLKKKNPQYLEKSYIIIRERSVLTLLDIIFLIQPPVAPVYITKTQINDFHNLQNIKIIKKYKPRKKLKI